MRSQASGPIDPAEAQAMSVARMAAADLIRYYFEAFNRGDLDAMHSCLTEDVIHDVNQGGRRHGLDAFRAFSARMGRHYEERFEDVVVMVSYDGSRASAEFNVRGKYLLTDPGLPEAKGQTYMLPAGAFFAIRDGKIARVTSYFNLADWLAQAAV